MKVDTLTGRETRVLAGGSRPPEITTAIFGGQEKGRLQEIEIICLSSFRPFDSVPTTVNDSKGGSNDAFKDDTAGPGKNRTVRVTVSEGASVDSSYFSPRKQQLPPVAQLSNVMRMDTRSLWRTLGQVGGTW